MTDQHAQQLPALQELREELVRVAEAEPRRSFRRSPRRAFLVVAGLLVLAVPAGFAIAQVTSQSDAVPASACPQANQALRQAGLPVPDYYGPGCPSPEQVQKVIDTDGLQFANPPGAESPPDVLRKALKEGRIQEGQDPSTYPPDIKRAIHAAGASP